MDRDLIRRRFCPISIGDFQSGTPLHDVAAGPRPKQERSAAVRTARPTEDTRENDVVG
jgi:hypothetical protein